MDTMHQRLPFFALTVLLIAGCATDDPSENVLPNNSASDSGLVADDGNTSTDVSTMEPPRDAGAELDAKSNDDTGDGPDAASPDLGTTDMAGADMQGEDVGGADMAQPGEPGETCTTAIDATAGGTFSGDTTTAEDDYSSDVTADNCPSGAVSGGDLVYRLAPSAETDYTVQVEPIGSFDPFIYVKSDCAAAACIDGTVLNGPGSPESLQLTVPGGAEYFVIVDGELLSEGEYTLTVTAQ